MAALSHLDEDAGGSLPLNLAMGHGGRVRRSDARISFPRYCRFISVAAVGGMLVFPASAQTGSSLKLQAGTRPPNPKRHHTRFRVPNSKHRHNGRRDKVPSPGGH